MVVSAEWGGEKFSQRTCLDLRCIHSWRQWREKRRRRIGRRNGGPIRSHWIHNDASQRIWEMWSDRMRRWVFKSITYEFSNSVSATFRFRNLPDHQRMVPSWGTQNPLEVFLEHWHINRWRRVASFITYPLRPNICTLGDAIRARWICQHLYTNLTMSCVPSYHPGTNGVFLLHQTFHHLGFPELSLDHWLQEQHASLPTMKENATSVHHTYRSLLTPTSEIT